MRGIQRRNEAISFKSLFAIAVLFSLGRPIAFAADTAKKWEEGSPTGWISQALKTWNRTGARCDLYADYWVLTAELPGDTGSNISVFKRNAADRFPEKCGSDLGKAWLQYRDDDYGSTSIYKDFLLLDNGTGNWRGLEIISIKDKKKITDIGYSGGASAFTIEGEELVYQGPLDAGDKYRASWQIEKKCVWRPENKPKGWFQEDYWGVRRINLRTGKQTVTGVKCEVGPAAG